MAKNISDNNLTVGMMVLGGEVIRQQITVKKIRLFFHGGAKSNSDNNSFLNTANNVRKDYVDNFDVAFFKVESAEYIVSSIEKQKNNSIQSIDFFSHGGIDALYIKCSSLLRANQSLYINDEVKKKNETYFEYSADLGEINYDKFTESAKIEVHGCKVGSSEPDVNGGKNFCSVFSVHLYNAGKTKSVVIGHVTNASPNRHNTLTGDDYRHGGRRVYHNGKELFFTRQEGHISTSDINQYLEGKK